MFVCCHKTYPSKLAKTQNFLLSSVRENLFYPSFFQFTAFHMYMYASMVINPFNHADPYRYLYPYSVDPDETACNELSHQDPHYLQFYFNFWMGPLSGTMVLTRFIDGRVYFRNAGMKGLNLTTENTGMAMKVLFTSITVFSLSAGTPQFLTTFVLYFGKVHFLTNGCVKILLDE